MRIDQPLMEAGEQVIEFFDAHEDWRPSKGTRVPIAWDILAASMLARLFELEVESGVLIEIVQIGVTRRRLLVTLDVSHQFSSQKQHGIAPGERRSIDWVRAAAEQIVLDAIEQAALICAACGRKTLDPRTACICRRRAWMRKSVQC